MEDVHTEPRPETDRPKPAPVMDVMPPSSPTPDNRQQVDAVKPPVAQQEHANSKAPAAQDTQPNNGVGMAITATVAIVIAMAVLATYAYLKTAK